MRPMQQFEGEKRTIWADMFLAEGGGGSRSLQIGSDFRLTYAGCYWI